ncbi:hypothetical protein VUR80DRAFT_6212 [Thermomyces stellatus]
MHASGWRLPQPRPVLRVRKPSALPSLCRELRTLAGDGIPQAFGAAQASGGTKDACSSRWSPFQPCDERTSPQGEHKHFFLSVTRADAAGRNGSGGGDQLDCFGYSRAWPAKLETTHLVGPRHLPRARQRRPPVDLGQPSQWEPQHMGFSIFQNPDSTAPRSHRAQVPAAIPPLQRSHRL